jgi:GWxTD domain-containing protein
LHHSSLLGKMKKLFCMKKFINIILSICSIAVVFGCNTPRLSNKSLPEAVVKATPSQQPVVKDELVLHTIQSRYQPIDSTLTRIYLYVEGMKGNTPVSTDEFIKLYNLNYVIYSDYGSRDRLGYGNIKLSEANVSRVNDKLTVTFDIKNPDREQGILLSEITQSGTLKKVLNDLSIKFKNPTATNVFAVYLPNQKLPLEKHYVRTNETVTIQKINGQSQPLTVRYYKNTFEPASSPMNLNPRTLSASLQADSVFTIQSNQNIQFDREGLYSITADTTLSEGMGLLVVDQRFPKVTKPQLLLQPLLYMSTNTEINEIKKSEDFKKSLDTYWLNLMNGDASLAQQSIRTYYGRVEEANKLFTTYKEGWKTDKGMIFVILGAPNKVQRSKDREVWTYTQQGNAQNVNFTFNRRNNQFVDDHYELVRYADYQPIWYPVVEAWRNGTIR